MLTDDILWAVDWLDANQGGWSIWDVTNRLRTNGREWTNLEYTDVYGHVNEIPILTVHKTVRAVFEHMEWGNYDVIQDSPYRIFRKKNVTSLVPPNAAIAKQVGASGLTWGDIYKYITTHGDRTTKQIQSALKINGVTCNDIKTVAEQNGATLETNPFPSKVVIKP